MIKNLATLMMASALLLGCEPKEDTKQTEKETISETDKTLSNATISADAKKEAEAAITAENVESEADKLLKEIESDNE